jgi:hypothetical protein
MPTARYYQDTYHREVMYVPNGIDINPKADIQAAWSRFKSLELSDKRCVMFAVDHIVSMRGCDAVLNAWPQVDVDVRLLVVRDSHQVLA